MAEEKKQLTPLSASRIKTLKSCSWKYYCQYILKLPDKTNEGASRGWICHLIFEVLGKKGRKTIFNKLVKAQDIFAVPSIKRLVFKHAKKLCVADEANIELIKEMTLNGLLYDFFGDSVEKPTQAFSELDFDITKDDGDVCFRVRGFIDKLFLYKNKSYALIRDFKSSKQKFSGVDIEDNLQDWIYSFAVKHHFPEYENRQSEFLFLKFKLDEDKHALFEADEGEIQGGAIKMQLIEDDELSGLEYELTEIQKLIDNFSEEDAVANMAYDKGYVDSSEGFAGRVMCGRAEYHGQLKKDGTPMWKCGYKLSMDYYHVFDKNGKLSGSYFEEDFDESLVPEGGSYEKKFYQGCSCFKHLNKPKTDWDLL